MPPPSVQPTPPSRRPTLFAMPTHLLLSSSSSSQSPLHTSPPQLPALPDQPSPPLSPPPIRQSREVRQPSQSLNRAVTGLENLVHEALNVARDAAQSGRNDEVASVLDSATIALRRASTVQGQMNTGRMSQPLVLSPAVSDLDVSDSESSVGPDSDASSARHSVDTVPTVLTRMLVDPESSRRKSFKASFETLDDRSPDRHSIGHTPPRLYQPPSAESVVRDFAYARAQTARAEAARQLSRSHGAAEAYYCDTGQPVAAQPGVRPSLSAPVMIDEPIKARSPTQRPSERPPDPEPPTPRRRRERPHRGHHLSDLFESPYYRQHPTQPPANDEKPRSISTEETKDRYSAGPTPPSLVQRNISLRHPRRKHISLLEGQGFSLGRFHRRKPIAREWGTVRKRITATIACLNTVFVGLITGIYAGEVPRIQYQLADTTHKVILGNVVLFACLGATTLIFWPLPLLHGRKAYTLISFALMLPLMFPQAIVISSYRNPNNPLYRCGLLIPRAFQGIAMGFANINFLPTLFDLFGASLMSAQPHQEIVVYDDVRRQGGGVGIWLGIWSFCFVGSMSIGFCVGALIISTLDPSWGFYIVVILLAFFLLVNVVAPETRRAPYRRSIAQFLDGEEKIKRRVARGEVKLHISNDGPRWWFEEVWAGLVLTKRMACQAGFFVMMVYLGWMYAQVTLVILLLGALLTRDYKWQPQYVGPAVLSVAIGALLAVPLSKANLFSRARDHPQRTDSMTMHAHHQGVHWTSHMLRRCMFTLTLPLAAGAYTLASPGPSVSWVIPSVMCGLVGFLSNLAIAECVGIIMETFDTCDLQPGVNQKHRLESMAETTRRRRTNYSSFPRICAGFFAAQSTGFFLSAAATGVSGDITRALGAQLATAAVAAILLGLTLLFIVVLWRWKEVQVIPNGAFGTMRGSIDWSPGMNDPEWKAVIIGNPSGKLRRMNLLELGALSRWTEIRRLNKLVRN
ncbi:hypothetical protein BDY17DRAFT_316877 [Neohortaea acidophila]|uniref:Major facilitator superfamily domain-containing protein n=1 Tax=Neohortaea acidophila TaxID=245834 RepID=A0A6A6PTW7_9PEZI|nr:uncharacterized protein BDY17DRAFT_316877 [Neohortaea acidophila]KAF2483559.1 hypothetical protein BDY17DRAFT_316877 [Neohortaea acidophila]